MLVGGWLTGWLSGWQPGYKVNQENLVGGQRADKQGASDRPTRVNEEKKKNRGKRDGTGPNGCAWSLSAFFLTVLYMFYVGLWLLAGLLLAAEGGRRPCPTLRR